jgi:hypothetical protein
VVEEAPPFHRIPFPPAARSVWDARHEGTPRERNGWGRLPAEGRNEWLRLTEVIAGPGEPGAVCEMDGRYATDIPGLHCAIGEAVVGRGYQWHQCWNALRGCHCGGETSRVPFTLVWHDADVARQTLAGVSVDTAGEVDYFDAVVPFLERMGVTVVPRWAVSASASVTAAAARSAPTAYEPMAHADRRARQPGRLPGAVSGNVRPAVAGLGTAILGAMGRASSHTRSWGPGDLTGGLVDQVFAQVRDAVPGLIIERLAVAHASDDDNVYYLGDGAILDRVQLDTGPGGQPPFLVEADDRVVTSDVAEAVAAVSRGLGSGDVEFGDDLT